MTMFPLSDSDHAPISTEIFFFFFLCGGIERDKVKHTGIADKGDEATIGKCRIKTVLGKGSSV